MFFIDARNFIVTEFSDPGSVIEDLCYDLTRSLVPL
jgi:hypothetical protein